MKTNFNIIVFFFLPCLFLITADLSSQNKRNKNILQTIKLPSPEYNSKTSVENALQKRRSARNYKNEPMTIKEISQLLWAAQGITAEGLYRTAPSAGALYPLEIYVAAENVKKLNPGLYKYIPKSHEIKMLIDSDIKSDLYKASLSQSPVMNAPAVIIITGEYSRTTSKYSDRGIRYVHIEAGHAAQNIYLQSVSLNLKTVEIGAFSDRKVKELMKLPEYENPLVIMPIGR